MDRAAASARLCSAIQIHWQPLPDAGATRCPRRRGSPAPLVLAQLTQFAIYSTDVLMLGWLGPKALAASALAVNLIFMFNFTGMGLVTACAPLFAAAIGARIHAVRDVRRSFRSAIHAALIFAAPAWLILWNCEAILTGSARILNCPRPPAASLGCCNGRCFPIS